MITVSPDTFPLAQVFTISRGSKAEARVLTVRVTRGGVTGWGECVPYPRYGDTLERVVAQISALPEGITREAVQTALPALAGAADIPLAGEPAAGLPGDVLRLRPDLVVAEAKLRAAHARIGASLAEYWPKISLMGLVGQQTNALASFASGSATVLQGAAGLRWRLFDFGRVDAEVAIARGRQREALAAWRGAVLAAGAQVEGGFVELAARRQAYAAAGQQAGDLARAYVRAKVAFQAGEISRDDLRMAELAMQDGEDAAVTARLALARAKTISFLTRRAPRAVWRMLSLN